MSRFFFFRENTCRECTRPGRQPAGILVKNFFSLPVAKVENVLYNIIVESEITALLDRKIL